MPAGHTEARNIVFHEQPGSRIIACMLIIRLFGGSERNP
jgi:hypothetical protein